MVWLKILKPTKDFRGQDKYVQIQYNVGIGIGTYSIFADWLPYKDYGIKWLAYKNKEQVCPHKVCCFPECENQAYCIDALVKAKIDSMKAKGEILELPNEVLQKLKERKHE